MTQKQINEKAVALTIAGSDPSGGAGLQADLKTFQQLGVYGMSVVSLLTVQNTQGVSRVQVLDPNLVLQQIDAVLADIPPVAIKTGALGSAKVVEAVGKRLANSSCPIVVDPVLVSKHGHALAEDDVIDAVRKYLLPVATLVTPNLFEIEKLVGVRPRDAKDFQGACGKLREMGVPYSLMKAGEQDGLSVHWIGSPDGQRQLNLPRIVADNTHGTGCILSAAVTARLALGECQIEEAMEFGISKTYQAIEFNSRLGYGIHPADVRGMDRQGMDD